MHEFSFSKYLKRSIKSSNYNCLYICNLRYIIYWDYSYYIEVFIHKGMLKISDINYGQFIFKKKSSIISMKFYDKDFNIIMKSEFNYT